MDMPRIPQNTSALLAAGSGSKVFEWGVLTKSTGHNDTYQGKSLTILPTGDVASVS